MKRFQSLCRINIFLIDEIGNFLNLTLGGCLFKFGKLFPKILELLSLGGNLFLQGCNFLVVIFLSCHFCSSIKSYQLYFTFPVYNILAVSHISCKENKNSASFSYSATTFRSIRYGFCFWRLRFLLRMILGWWILSTFHRSFLYIFFDNFFF